MVPIRELSVCVCVGGGGVGWGMMCLAFGQSRRLTQLGVMGVLLHPLSCLTCQPTRGLHLKL